jgi:hypothetical protein
MAIPSSLPPSDEAMLHHRATMRSQSSAWTGWVSFAVGVLVLIGALNMFQGLLALFDEGYFVARGDELVLMSYDAWGVVQILWGGLLILTGASLERGRSWARWAAILGVLVHAVLQVGFLPALPLLSVTLIALDVVVLYALTVRWHEAQAGY